MKTRPAQTARPASARRRFVLHPLSFAICLAISGTALALPQGGTVVAGDATISKPTPSTELIRQTTDKAIIDWKSFSIASGERVRFEQPSSTAITLNRVVGYDPSRILGQMSSNGKIFLVNPYGVVFGAGARVDVGGLVVSTLSIANNDFLASRYSLSSVDAGAPAQRGEIRNEGVISAPGGLVVLAGPSVTNSGTIVAAGGRVGLAAANAVSVDVEGDGLVFFQASASEARNRLDQLGRIQADGGTVDMRATARAAFADTVLNMAGVVQAKTIGTREGRIVIDGGDAGVTAVSGRLDASGGAAGSRGGEVTVQGQLVLLDSGSRVDASGDAGGGLIRIGGDFHGANPDLRNASQTLVMPGAELHADAATRGDGGRIVVWADDNTRYYGSASARGGAQGGNGGFAEVSGKESLDFAGTVDLRAAQGATGTLLLDPKNINIALAGATPVAGNTTFANFPAQTANMSAANVVAALTAASLVLQANNDITITSDVNAGAALPARNLTLQAGRSISISSGVTVTTGGGSVTLKYNDDAATPARRDPGPGVLALTGSTITTKGGAISITRGTAGASGPITLGTLNSAGTANVAGGAVSVVTTDDIVAAAISTSAGATAAGAGLAAGNITLTSTAGGLATTGVLTAIGSDAFLASGANGGNAGAIALSGSAGIAIGAAISTAGGVGDGAGLPGSNATVSLTSGGAVTQSAGFITASTLSGTAGGAVLLDGGANAIAALGPIAFSGNFALNDGAVALTLTNPINAGANNVALNAGSLTQTAAGIITANTFSGSAATGANLSAATNVIANLGAFSSPGGNFVLNDTGTALTVTGAVNAGANTVDLRALSLAETAGGSITAGTLLGTITNGVALGTGTNAIAALGAIAFNGNFALNDGAVALTLTNPINAGANNVTLNAGSLSQTAAGIITASTLSGSAATGADLTAATNVIANLGAFSSPGGNFSLNDTGTALTVTGAVNAGANTVDLRALSLAETAAGAITAGTLTGTIANGVALGTGTNAVANLGAFTFNGPFNLNNGATALNLTSALNAGVNNVTL
ncbi:MAG: filamentous hemagglutinin N-terminal domain-containing protein, partial [Caldimonas sp.]